MNNYKNLLIVILTGLLALSLFTQPAQSAGSSKDAKIVEYTKCLEIWNLNNVENRISYLDSWIKSCAKYRPWRLETKSPYSLCEFCDTKPNLQPALRPRMPSAPCDSGQLPLTILICQWGMGDSANIAREWGQHGFLSKTHPTIR